MQVLKSNPGNHMRATGTFVKKIAVPGGRIRPEKTQVSESQP